MLIGLLVVFCALTVSMVSTLLVLHRDYEDGLLGRIGLSFMALAGSARAMHLLIHGLDMPSNPIAVLLWIGLALFMVRHLYRFMRWRRSGEYDWRGVDDTATCGKR